MRKRAFGLVMAATLSAAAGCQRDAGQSAAYEASAAAARYPISGVVQAASADGRRVSVAHDEIPGFMDAMTMSFALKEDWAVKVAAPGDRLTGTLVVDGARSWIEGTSLTKPPEGDPTSAPGDTGLGPAPGTPLPAGPLRDQAGREVTAKDFIGRDLVVTFIYTRCPLPDYCPLMMSRLDEVAARLHKAGRRGEVHMLAISIDPAHDTPPVLAAYGRTHIKADGDAPFAHWSLLTGTPQQVGVWASFFGLAYEEEGTEIVHGLRTAVVDGEGRVVGVLRGNDWTTNQLMSLLPD